MNSSGSLHLVVFAFGLPSAIKIDKGTFLAVHWCKEDGIFGIRSARLQI